MSIEDNGIEQLSGWFTQSGPNIGGVPPTSFGSTLLPGMRQFYTNGPPYADGLNAIKRPILPNSGYLNLSFDLMTDVLTPTFAQALEFDTRISISKTDYNFSGQFNYAEGGTFQIVDKSGKWIDTGWKPGKFQPYVWYPITFQYGFDTTKKAFSFLSASNGIGSPFSIPKAMQGILSGPLAWDDTCNLQVQLDLAQAGGQYSIFTRGMKYMWE
jgi:hypothetical protein